MTSILVIEDELANRVLLTRYLERAGYAVDAVENASDALRYLGHNRPSLIFLDVHLPGMNGLEFSRIIKQEAVTADIPIVVVSAYGDPQDKAEALAAGCDGHITKPIDFKVLHNYLERFGKQSRLA